MTVGRILFWTCCQHIWHAYLARFMSHPSLWTKSLGHPCIFAYNTCSLCNEGCFVTGPKIADWTRPMGWRRRGGWLERSHRTNSSGGMYVCGALCALVHVNVCLGVIVFLREKDGRWGRQRECAHCLQQCCTWAKNCIVNAFLETMQGRAEFFRLFVCRTYSA